MDYDDENLLHIMCNTSYIFDAILCMEISFT
jgi:hypothetical protein